MAAFFCGNHDEEVFYSPPSVVSVPAGSSSCVGRRLSFSNEGVIICFEAFSMFGEVNCEELLVVWKAEDTKDNTRTLTASTQVDFSRIFPVLVTPMIWEALPPKAAPTPPFEFWPRITKISNTERRIIILMIIINML